MINELDRKRSLGSSLLERLWKFTTRNLPWWRQRLGSRLEHPIYVVFVAAISCLNSFFPFFPVELFVILRVLRRPREWWALSGLAVAASVVGTLILAHLFQLHSSTGLTAWLAHHLGQASWDHVATFVRSRGAYGLFLVAISFLPLPPAVAVCALSRVPAWEIAASIGGAHCLKYGFFSWLASNFTHWFGDWETVES